MACALEKSDERSVKDRDKEANVRMQRTVVNTMDVSQGDTCEDVYRLWRILQNPHVFVSENKLQLRLRFEKP